jgi:predicted transcriptional regulator
VNRKKQIEQRRNAVLELSARGLSQTEIAEQLGVFHISQPTISRDLTYLRNESNEYIKRSREHLAHEYRLVLSNFKQLRKLAWKDFNEAKEPGIKTHLYHILLDINNDLMNLHSISDIIEAEMLLQQSKNKAENTREAMNTLVDQQSSEAVF